MAGASLGAQGGLQAISVLCYLGKKIIKEQEIKLPACQHKLFPFCSKGAREAAVCQTISQQFLASSDRDPSQINLSQKLKEGEFVGLFD